VPDAARPTGAHDYPLTFSVDYPDRNLDRVSTAFRIFAIIPIAILAAAVEGGSFGGDAGGRGVRYAGGGIGILVIPVVLMLLFRKKYPRWWYDWNLQLTRFSNRIVAYLGLMDDRYPSTDEQQAVHVNFPYPDAERDLSRGLPLIKWLLAIPHYIVLFFLTIGAVGNLRLVRNPLHGPLPAIGVRLHRGRAPVAQPRRRLRVPADHRPLPTIQPPAVAEHKSARGSGRVRRPVFSYIAFR
jgi:hypothetical protein